jgi:hypothetical protein
MSPLASLSVHPPVPALARAAGRVRRALGRFLPDRRGAILVEMAFAVPIVLVMILGCFDTGRYILLHQKLDRAASTMADLVSRPTSISSAEITKMFTAAQELMDPYDLSQNGLVIITSVSQASGDSARIDWQEEGGGGLSASSDLGDSAGDLASLPSGFTMRDGENVIFAEVFYDHEPMFLGDILGSGVIWHTAVRKPRRGDLSTLN